MEQKTLEQKYVGYDTYTPEQHRQQIEAKQKAVAQTKNYFVEFYKQQKAEEDKRNEEFNQREIQVTHAPPTQYELLEKQVKLLEQLLKQSQTKGDK